MSELLIFFKQYGAALSLIALAGIVILGILKYANVFSKLEERYRHICYIVISVGLSLIGSCIYLVSVDQFTSEYVLTLGTAIFALNQTFYAIYSSISLKELVGKIFDYIENWINSKKNSNK